MEGRVLVLPNTVKGAAKDHGRSYSATLRPTCRTRGKDQGENIPSQWYKIPNNEE